jgi:hypothetical protein
MTQPRTIRRFGWIPDAPDQRDHLYSAPAQFLLALPAAVDLRAKCPPVYDQGNLGSCTANAIAGAIEFDRKKQRSATSSPRAFSSTTTSASSRARCPSTAAR